MALIYNISRIAAVSEASFEQGLHNARAVGAGIFGSNLARVTEEAYTVALFGSNTAVYASNTVAYAVSTAVAGSALAASVSQTLLTTSQTWLTTATEAVYASNAASQFFDTAVITGNTATFAYNTAVAASSTAATAASVSTDTAAQVAGFAQVLGRANDNAISATSAARSAATYASNVAGSAYGAAQYASNSAGVALAAAGYASNAASSSLSVSHDASGLSLQALAASCYASNSVVSPWNAAAVRSNLALSGLSGAYLGPAPALTVTPQGLVGIACTPTLYGLQVAQTVRMAGRAGANDVPASVSTYQLSSVAFYGGNDGVMYGTVTLAGGSNLGPGQGLAVQVPLGFKSSAPYLVTATSVAGLLPCHVTGKTSSAFTLQMFNPYQQAQPVAGCVVDFHIVSPI